MSLLVQQFVKCSFFVQTFQEGAPPCLTLTHYTDLAESKALVLMSGEVDTKMMVSEMLDKLSKNFFSWAAVLSILPI